MLKNFIKIAWRNFQRNKSYTLINILGLSIGLACIILIALFITDELSFDKFHDKKDRIYFVGKEKLYESGTSRGLSTPYPLGPTMKREIPEVKRFVVTMWPGSGGVSLDGKTFVQEERILTASEEFFEVFSFPLVTGNPENVLDKPTSVVLTESMAAKYFPNENPLGKTIIISRFEEREYTVTGIAENLKHNSYVNFDFITSLKGSSYAKSNRDSWGTRMFNTYVLLKKNTHWDQITPEIESMILSKIGEDANTAFFPIPITDLYLSEHVTANGFKGSMKYILFFYRLPYSFFCLPVLII